MSALSKARLIEVLCEQLALTKPDARRLVDQFFESMRDELEHGRHVKLSGFGNFILRDKTERPGRNPKTGEIVPVTARRVVTFKPGSKLKERIELKEDKNKS
ncbi:MAG: integration host factor subunit alpha [Legionellaceae bacterium]|nr:integration host factor subunit alpha [Legionellaceae bacterium]